MNIKVDGDDIFDSIVKNFNIIEKHLEYSKKNSLKTDNDKKNFNKIINKLNKSDDEVKEYILKILDSKDPIIALALYDHNVRKFKDLKDKEEQYGGYDVNRYEFKPYTREDRMLDNKTRAKAFSVIGSALIYAGSIATGGAPVIGFGVISILVGIYWGYEYYKDTDYYRSNNRVVPTAEARQIETADAIPDHDRTERYRLHTNNTLNRANSYPPHRGQNGGNMYMNKDLCKSIQEFMEENNIEEMLEELKNPPEGQIGEFERLTAKLKAQLGETAEATEEAEEERKKAEEYVKKGGRRMRKLKGKSLKKRGGRKSIKNCVKKVVKKGGRKSVRKTLNKRGRKSVRR